MRKQRKVSLSPGRINRNSAIVVLCIVLISVSFILDGLVMRLVPLLQHPWLLFLAGLFNDTSVIVGILIVMAALFLGTSARWRWAPPAGASIALAWLLSYFIKLSIMRPRPGGLVMVFSALGMRFIDYSFPSSHAAVAFAGLPFLLHAAPRWKWWFIAGCSLVAISRVYIGVHYPSDVIAGAALGYLVGTCMVLLFLTHHET